MGDLMSDIHHPRYDDMPKQLKWVMTFVNRLGFPILVCMWLAYQQFVEAKEQRKAMVEFREAIVSLTNSINLQNNLLRRRHRDD